MDGKSRQTYLIYYNSILLWIKCINTSENNTRILYKADTTKRV